MVFATFLLEGAGVQLVSLNTKIDLPYFLRRFCLENGLYSLRLGGGELGENKCCYLVCSIFFCY